MADNEKIYEALEIAKNTGKIKKGANEVTKAVEKGAAKMVVIAKDTNPPEIIMHLPPLCKEKGVICLEVPSKDDLGAAIGLQRSTSAVAVVEEGEAKSLVKEFSAKKTE